MRDIVTPTIAILTGMAMGVYVFQPIVLEQLKKDNNLNPKYEGDYELTEEKLGDLVTPSNQKLSNQKPK